MTIKKMDREAFDWQTIKITRLKSAIDGTWDIFNLIEQFKLNDEELDTLIFQNDLLMKALKERRMKK